MSEREPKVFITQVPSRRDAQSGLWVPTVNIAPAEQFGKVETLLPPGSQFFAAAETTRLIKQRLHDLDYQMGDYLLPMGNPVIMAVASAIAARRTNGCLNVLVWDRHSSSYVSYELENLN
jgi:hypothetical protein